MMALRSDVFLRLALVIWLGLWGSASAVEPDEVLSDPVLEARARDISKELRCVVCQNESIDESNAEVAKDLRLLVRERLLQGDSDDEVRTYVVERFGEFVLFKPLFTPSTLILWLSGPILFLCAMVILFVTFRRRAASSQGATALSAEEERRLQEILSQEEKRS